MRIAIAQMSAVLGDFDATVERMVAQTRLARERGARLTIFPMPVLTGYDLGDLLGNDAFMAGIARALESFGRRAETDALVPFLTSFAGAPMPEVGYISKGELMPLRMAAYLRSLMNRGFFGAEDPKVAFSVGDVEVAVCTSYESLEAYGSGSKSADVLVYLPSAPFDTDDEASVLAPAIADGAFVRTAVDGNCWLVAAGAVGAADDVVYPGGSFVLTPWGELFACAPSFEEHLLVADVDPLFEGPVEERVEPVAYDRKRFIWDALSLALRDAVERLGYEGVAVALEGDILTSALAVLAVDALGPTRVSALIVPTRDLMAAQDARRLAQNLRVTAHELKGGDLDAMARMMGTAPDEASRIVSGAWLASAAQRGNLLSLTSADKTALATGQDPDGLHSAGYAPFKDVYRSDLVSLLPERNLVSPVVPSGVLKRLLVPEGLDLEVVAATDERRLSALDAALLAHVEHGLDVAGMADHGIDAELARLVVRRLDETQLQRRSCPFGPVVSDCALSECERPIPCEWHDEGERAEPTGGLPVADAEDEEGGFSITLPEDMMRNLPAEILSYLRDFASGGGFDAAEGDVWAQGLFSNN